MNADMSQLHVLTQRKVELERLQAVVAREFNGWLTAKGGDKNPDEDGAIENSKKKMKNLEAAIATARQPGYFEYHRRSKKVRYMEKKQELKRLDCRLASIQAELETVNVQIAQFYANKRAAQEAAIMPTVSGLKEWFARYERPNKHWTDQPGLTTEFVPNTKVYGGTSHHKAFKSVAVALKRGRLTR